MPSEHGSASRRSRAGHSRLAVRRSRAGHQRPCERASAGLSSHTDAVSVARANDRCGSEMRASTIAVARTRRPKCRRVSACDSSSSRVPACGLSMTALGWRCCLSRHVVRNRRKRHRGRPSAEDCGDECIPWPSTSSHSEASEEGKLGSFAATKRPHADGSVDRYSDQSWIASPSMLFSRWKIVLISLPPSTWAVTSSWPSSPYA